MRKNFIRTLASLLVVVMLVCAVPVVGFSASATNIPSDAVEFNGHHYKVYDVGMTWKDSEKYCESLGGHLATVTSNDEQLFIEKLLLNAPKNVYWLGASDEEREGVWKWITGEEFSYSKWAYKQPDNNLNGTEDFLMIYKKNKSKCT